MSVLLKNDILYHLEENVMKKYMISTGNIISGEKLTGENIIINEIIYQNINGKLYSRTLESTKPTLLFQDVPKSIEYIYFYKKEPFFVQKNGDITRLFNKKESIFTNSKIIQYLFEQSFFYFLDTNSLKKFNLLHKSVELLSEAPNISCFAVKSQKLVLGFKSGKIQFGDNHFHWHSSGVKIICLSDSGNEIYSVSSKNIVHQYSIPTKRSKVLFSFLGSFLHMCVVDKLLIVTTKCSIVIYSLKYEAEIKTIYLIRQIDKLCILNSVKLLLDYNFKELEIRKDLLDRPLNLTKNTLAFKNDQIIFYYEFYDHRFLKIFSPGPQIKIEDFFSDNINLYILTEHKLLLYSIKDKHFSLIKSSVCKKQLKSLDNVCLNDKNTLFVLSHGNIYKIDLSSDTYVRKYSNIITMFSLGEDIYKVDGVTISSDKEYKYKHKNIRCAYFNDMVYLVTNLSIVILSLQWIQTQEIMLKNVKDLLKVNNEILILTEDISAKKLLVFGLVGESYQPISENKIDNSIEKIFSKKCGIDKFGNINFL